MPRDAARVSNAGEMPRDRARVRRCSLDSGILSKWYRKLAAYPSQLAFPR